LIKLAVLQWQIAFGNIQENRKKVLELLSPLEDSLVVLPEMFPCGFDYDNLKNHAKESQRLLEELRELSKEKRLTLIGTYPEEGEGKLFNTAFVLSDGLLVGKRDKIKPFPLYREGEHFSPGQENPVFETRHGKVGVLVCFELRFPNLGWELRKKGAQLIAVPSLWGAKRKEHLRVLSQARAVELQSYLLLSNGWGRTGEEEYAGNSAIYDPWGNTLAFSEVGDSVLLVYADLKKVEAVRRLIPVD
jgi:predicted amidohydrolase